MTALRPPPEWEHLRWHWLASPGHPEGEVLQWTADKCWWSTEDASDLWPDKMRGWTYLKPCHPDAILPDPDNAAMVEGVEAEIHRSVRDDPDHDPSANTVARRVLRALREFRG